jgi:hypothetical protein
MGPVSSASSVVIMVSPVCCPPEGAARVRPNDRTYDVVDALPDRGMAVNPLSVEPPRRPAPRLGAVTAANMYARRPRNSFSACTRPEIQRRSEDTRWDVRFFCRRKSTAASSG